ncbi:MAG: hypothetical protein AB2417_16955 [Clostridiaceae bacterium]
MSNKYIYLIFTRTGTWLSQAIGVFSETKYVHASVSFDSSFRKMYSFGRTNPNNPFSGGLVEESLYGGVYRKFRRSECLIYRVPVTEEQYNSLKKEVEIFLTEKQKYRYNFLGLFGVLLNKPFKRRNYYFCSQFVSEVLIKSNIYNPHKVPELVRADDLFEIGNKEFIYEGFINDYYRFDCLYSFS